MKAFCQVALRQSTRRFDRAYTYAVPRELRDQIEIGSLVEVPFGGGNRLVSAFVIALMDDALLTGAIKSVQRLLSDRPLLRSDQIALADRMRERYLCTYGDAFRCMVPAAVASVRDRRVRLVSLQDPEDAAERLASGEIDRLPQIQVLELLLDFGPAPLQEVLAACQVSRSTITTLVKKDLIRLDDQVEPRVTVWDEKIPEEQPFVPNDQQKAAIEMIVRAAREAVPGMEATEHLLFGVTGSGKTEVYLQAARQVYEQGRGVLILVPEIALTPQMIARIRGRFADGVAVLHSRLTPADRYEQWRRILADQIRIVVGVRSAVFAPLRDIGLIVLDEEQESSYKSETHPRYHARDIAQLRARAHGATLVFGSATPSAEIWQRCLEKSAKLLRLSQRIGAAGQPASLVVDMRRELAAGNRSIFSRELTVALEQAFANGRQAMLFINRRGHSGSVLCRNCGESVRCFTCSVAMTTHVLTHLRDESEKMRMICHYCGQIRRIPDRCPACGSERIGRFGAGTQQVEEVFRQAFPGRSAIRMDQDTTSGRMSHQDILTHFAEGGADVLIGTQMIAKGHDYPNVTVVGILAADLMLGIPDFRASERAFQLITQASGRAGRGQWPGRVIIQAYRTEDAAVRFAAAADVEGFLAQELRFRASLGYPPCGALIALTFSASDNRIVEQKCREFHSALTARCNSELGFKMLDLPAPARAPIYLLRGRFRWRLILKGPSLSLLVSLIRPILDRFEFGNASLVIDPDPYVLF